MIPGISILVRVIYLVYNGIEYVYHNNTCIAIVYHESRVCKVDRARSLCQVSDNAVVKNSEINIIFIATV